MGLNCICQWLWLLIVTGYLGLPVLSYTPLTFNTRSVLECESCALKACPKIPLDCELVREIGVCACCMTCARQEGEACGLSVGRCGRGLKCRPLPGDPDPMLAMILGKAVCQSYSPKYSFY